MRVHIRNYFGCRTVSRKLQHVPNSGANRSPVCSSFCCTFYDPDSRTYSKSKCLSDGCSFSGTN